MSDDNFDIDDFHRRSGIAAMVGIDAVNTDFLKIIVQVHKHTTKAYEHLTEHHLTHGAASGMLHGVLASIIEQARTTTPPPHTETTGGEGPE